MLTIPVLVVALLLILAFFLVLTQPHECASSTRQEHEHQPLTNGRSSVRYLRNGQEYYEEDACRGCMEIRVTVLKRLGCTIVAYVPGSNYSGDL